MSTKKICKFVSLTALLLVSSCQKNPEQKDYEDSSKQTTIIGGGGSSVQNQRQLINVPLIVDYQGFALATPATAFSMSLDGCLSGYTDTVDETNIDGMEVYKDDRNCLAKLTSFEIGGVTYNNVNVGAVDFTTWLTGNKATFADSSANLISVEVISQLNTPITGTEAIVYNFSNLADGQGDQTLAESDISDAHAISVDGSEPPPFNLINVAFQGMDDITGAPEYILKLECVDDPTLLTPTSIGMGVGSAADSLCNTTDLADVSYKLVQDTFSSTITLADADTIFLTPGSPVTLPTDQYQDSATNEGFFSSVIDGPGPLGTAGMENMILVLKANGSYTYFNIDVTTITQ